MDSYMFFIKNLKILRFQREFIDINYSFCKLIFPRSLAILSWGFNIPPTSFFIFEPPVWGDGRIKH
jgi:hypothetical protein